MTTIEVFQGASRRLARTIPFRPFRLTLDRPLVSFSFDDFPTSAAEHAAPLLEAQDARGTFYFADGLAGGVENGQPIAGRADVAALAARGHDIGGHTSGHLNVQRSAPGRLLQDVAWNNAEIAALTGQGPSSFAYPYGVVSLNSKRLLAHRYRALRGIQPGINRGWIDLAHLLAQELYDHSLPPARLAPLLGQLQSHGGWLIFYTHDVRDDPSSIGCSPAHFAMVLAAVRARGIEVVSVAKALDRIGVAR